MNPKHVHTPVSTRARCPVCHKEVYSRAGIHPQCAVRLLDPPKHKNKAKDGSAESESEPQPAEADPAS
jgi:hypothetical protein